MAAPDALVRKPGLQGVVGSRGYDAKEPGDGRKYWLLVIYLLSN